jgi:hypothetical protein
MNPSIEPADFKPLSLRAATTTRAPRRAKSLATSLPMPLDAPKITIICSLIGFNLICILPSLIGFLKLDSNKIV